MPNDLEGVDPASWTSFGVLLRYLRRRARLTQRDLGIAVGYSEGHINRFEKDKRLPEPSAVAALFVPALDLTHDSVLAARLIELAANGTTATHSDLVGEPIPPAPAHHIPRAGAFARARARLADEHRLALCGLPGIGKTTLASMLARDYCHAMPVFWLTLVGGINTSTGVWVHRLAEFLLAQGQEQLKPLVAQNGARGKLSLDQQMALLGSALVKQTALLCFDNAELIRHDGTCLQLLGYLSATTPVFLLLTTRECLPLVHIPEINLDGFDRDEALAFIAQSSEHALDETLAARLADKTGGSPMLLQLALGQLGGQGAEAERFIAHLETQPQVASYLLQTYQAQSSPSAWRLLCLLAVFQEPLNLYDAYLRELIEACGGMENIGAAIEELQRRHMIGDATSAQLHPFIREYIYLTLSGQLALRQRLHRLAGDWLKDTNRDVVTAAMHYNRAGLPDQALDWLEENRETIRTRDQALSAVAILDEIRPPLERLRRNHTDARRRWLTLRGVLLRDSVRSMEGENDLREAVGLAGTPAVRAATILELVQLTARRKDHAETLRLVQAARAELGPEDLVLHTRLAQAEASAYRAAGNQAESDRKAMEALALVDRMIGLPLTLSDAIRARSHYDLAINAYHRRDLRTAMSETQLALGFARAAHHAGTANMCLNQLGILSKEAGELDASTDYFHEAVEGMLAMGDTHSAAYALSNLAANNFALGETSRALEQAEQACETFRAVGDMSGLAGVEDVRTDCLVWEGRIQEARHAMDRLIQEAEGRGTASLWGYRLRKLALIQLVQGETDAAIATLRRALDLPTIPARPMMAFVIRTTLALAWSVAGDLEAAARALADAPTFEGLACFVEYERDLIEGFVALARGDEETAQQRADRVLQRAGEYPLYRQSADQLHGAIREGAPACAFPRLAWVKCEVKARG